MSQAFPARLQASCINKLLMRDTKTTEKAESYQEDELGLLVVECSRRSAERGGGVLRAVRGGVPKCLSGHSVVIQLLFKVCPTHKTHRGNRNTQKKAGESNPNKIVALIYFFLSFFSLSASLSLPIFPLCVTHTPKVLANSVIAIFIPEQPSLSLNPHPTPWSHSL